MRGASPIVHAATPPTPAPTPEEPPKQKPTGTFVQVSQVQIEEKKIEVTPSLFVDLPLDTLKNALFDSVKYVDRGVKSSREDRSEIAEYITQLEGKNPNPSPTEAPELLNGKWKLIYTSNPRFLTAVNLPNVELGEIIQNIDVKEKTLKTDFQFKLPALKTTVGVVSSFEALSAKRWKLKFEKNVLEKPVVEENVGLPQSINIAGQDIDIGQLVQPLAPVADQFLKQISDILAQAPAEFPLPSSSRQRDIFILTTYLDEDLRITKSLNGTVFVTMKIKEEEKEEEDVEKETV